MPSGLSNCPFQRSLGAPRDVEEIRCRELLNPVIARIGHIEKAAGVRREPRGRVELCAAGSQGAPRGDERARRGELLDALVLAVRHGDVSRWIDIHICGARQISIIHEEGTPLSDPRARVIVLLDAAVVRVGDVDEGAVCVQRQSLGGVELLGCRAERPPLGHVGCR